MINHIFMPGVLIGKRTLLPIHQTYLDEWHEEAIKIADNGDVSSTICLQAALIELTKTGQLTHDWIGIFDEYLLTEDGLPIAYSKNYGKRLHGFENQTIQTTIQAIHTRWWLENIQKDSSAMKHEKFAELLISTKLINGLFYDHDISETILRHRMKSELMMSLAYSIEIILAANKLNNDLKIQIIASLNDNKKCPPTGYISAEYFRLLTLNLLNATHHFPNGIEDTIDACAVNLQIGYCDFSMLDKRDAYMGTTKRIARDKPIHSPLTVCHVAALLKIITDNLQKEKINERINDYSMHLIKYPMDIPSFQMRDIPIPFGIDKTPIEILCAASLIQRNIQ